MNKVGFECAIMRLPMMVVNNVAYAIVIAHGNFGF